MSDERREIAGLTCAEWNPDGSPTILALHGLTSTSEVWRGFAETLPGARLIAPDLPGRGGSAGVTAGERVDANHLTMIFDRSASAAAGV
jgi:pimeloyl-ACP methyl ester carboxylesterase